MKLALWVLLPDTHAQPLHLQRRGHGACPQRHWLLHGQGLGKASATQDFSFHRISSNPISKALLLWTICQDPETALLHKGARVMKFIRLDSSSREKMKLLRCFFCGQWKDPEQRTPTLWILILTLLAWELWPHLPSTVFANIK